MDTSLSLPSILGVWEFLRSIANSLKSNEDSLSKRMAKKLEQYALKIERCLEPILNTKDIDKIDEEIDKILPKWYKQITYFGLSLMLDKEFRDFMLEQFEQLQTISALHNAPHNIPPDLQKRCAKMETSIIKSITEFFQELREIITEDSPSITDIENLKEELLNTVESDPIFDYLVRYSLLAACYSKLNQGTYSQKVSMAIAKRFANAADLLNCLIRTFSAEIQVQKNPHKFFPLETEHIEVKKIPKTKYSLYKGSWCVEFYEKDLGVYKYGETIEKAYKKFWNYVYDLVLSLEQSKRDGRINEKMKKKLAFFHEHFTCKGTTGKQNQYVFSQKDLENKPTWKGIPILSKEDFQNIAPSNKQTQ